MRPAYHAQALTGEVGDGRQPLKEAKVLTAAVVALAAAAGVTVARAGESSK